MYDKETILLKLIEERSKFEALIESESIRLSEDMQNYFKIVGAARKVLQYCDKAIDAVNNDRYDVDENGKITLNK